MWEWLTLLFMVYTSLMNGKQKWAPHPLIVQASSVMHGLRNEPLPCDLEWKFKTQTVLFPFALLEVNRVDCCVT